MVDIKQLVENNFDELVALRRDFHEHPELGYHEERTAAKVEEALKALNLKDVRRVTKTGVSALLEGTHPGPVLLLRADLDALPVDETTDLPYASKTPGVMHACGHDGHTAILMTAAKILAGLKDELYGSVKFVYEPNEEEVGALAMIEEGVMDNPKVDAAAGLHLWAPLPLGHIAVDPGPCWAGMAHFTIKVKGRGGHTSAPHTAVDPILVAAHIVVGLQVLQSRELDPFLASSLVFGRVGGGRAANIIPDEVELEGTIRYLFNGSDDGPHKPKVRLRELAESIAKAYRAVAEVDFYCSQPSLENDPVMCELGREAARETLGSDGGLIKFLNMGGEDFSEFSSRVPSVFAMIGAGNEACGAIYPHHHAKFSIDEQSLAVGLEWLLRTTLKYLKGQT